MHLLLVEFSGRHSGGRRSRHGRKLSIDRLTKLLEYPLRGLVVLIEHIRNAEDNAVLQGEGLKTISQTLWTD